MSDSRWVITPSWLFGLWRSFLYSSSMYSCHLFLISSASVRSVPFLSFIEPIFAWNVPLVSLIFLKTSLVSHSIVFLYFFALITEEGFLISSCYSLEPCIQMLISFLFSFAFSCNLNITTNLTSHFIWISPGCPLMSLAFQDPIHNSLHSLSCVPVSSALWITHFLLVCHGFDSLKEDWPGIVEGPQAEFVCCYSHNVEWASGFVFWGRHHRGEMPFLCPHIREQVTTVCLTSGYVTDWMDMSLNKLREMVKDKEAWHAAVHGVTKSRTWLSNWTTTMSVLSTWSCCVCQVSALFSSSPPLFFGKELLSLDHTQNESESCSVVSDSLEPLGLYSPWNSPGQNTGVCSLSLLQGNLPNSGIEPRSPTLWADSLPAEPQGKPKNPGVGSLSLFQRIFLTQESN